MILSAWIGTRIELKCSQVKWELNQLFTDGISKENALRLIKELLKGALLSQLIKSMLQQLEWTTIITFMSLIKIKVHF